LFNQFREIHLELRSLSFVRGGLLDQGWPTFEQVGQIFCMKDLAGQKEMLYTVIFRLKGKITEENNLTCLSITIKPLKTLCRTI
jgi:hypothetical protein